MHIYIWHPLDMWYIHNIVLSMISDFNLTVPLPFECTLAPFAAVKELGLVKGTKSYKSSILGVKLPEAAVSKKQCLITGLSPRNIDVSTAENKPCAVEGPPLFFS